jgi:hypothetical protein
MIHNCARLLKHLFVPLILFAANASHGQDTIRLVSGSYIAGHVEGIGPYRISYKPLKRPANRSAAARQVSKSIVTYIRYADGRLEPIVLRRQTSTADSGANTLSPFDLYELGRSDARLYYRRYTGASNGTLIAACPGSPALGLIVAVATGETPPKEKNLGIPTSALSTDQDYRAGYKARAHDIKRGKVWVSWCVGSAATLLLYFMLTARQ